MTKKQTQAYTEEFRKEAVRRAEKKAIQQHLLVEN
jgi:hypothetical protein